MNDTGLDITHYIRCERKHNRFRKPGPAEALAERLTRIKKRLYIAYKCYDCGLWHVGRADNSQVVAREQEKQRALFIGMSPKAKHKEAKYNAWMKLKAEEIKAGRFCQFCNLEIPESRYQLGNDLPIYCSELCSRRAMKRRQKERKHRKEVKGASGSVSM